MHGPQSKSPGGLGGRKILSENLPSALCLSSENLSGFTLVEILLALFIFAVVLSLIFTSYTGTFRIIDETEYRADIYRMARITLERMHEDLASTYAPQYPESPESEEENGEAGEFSGTDAEISGRRADSLRFTSRAHLVFSEEDRPSGTAEIDYYVEESDEGEGFVLFRRDTPGVGKAGDEETAGLVLCEKLRSVSFTYYDAEGEAYDNWDSTGEEFKNSAPLMVSIKLEFADKSNPETPFTFFTSVALPIGGEKEGA